MAALTAPRWSAAPGAVPTVCLRYVNARWVNPWGSLSRGSFRWNLLHPDATRHQPIERVMAAQVRLLPRRNPAPAHVVPFTERAALAPGMVEWRDASELTPGAVVLAEDEWRVVDVHRTAGTCTINVASYPLDGPARLGHRDAEHCRILDSDTVAVATDVAIDPTTLP